MDVFLYIVKILYYLAFVVSLFFYARYKYKKDKITKFGWVALILFAVAFGAYAIICGPPGESTGDRSRYAVRFENTGYENFTMKSSLGLYLLQEFLHLFTWDSSVLFFVVGFLFCVINLYCYKKTEKEVPLFLLLLFSARYALFGFFALKQALALAFVNLAYTAYWRDKKWWALLALVVVVLFHESALIMIPCILIAEFCKKTDKRRKILYGISMALVLLFPLIGNLFVKVASLMPWLGGQLANYVNGDGFLALDFNFFTIFNSLVYYVITAVVLVYRKKLKEKIENYDFFLILAIFCSVFSLLSMYMYWMFRFAMFFYVPTFILATQIYQNIENKRKRKIFLCSVVGILSVFMIKLLVQYYFIYGGIV